MKILISFFAVMALVSCGMNGRLFDKLGASSLSPVKIDKRVIADASFNPGVGLGDKVNEESSWDTSIDFVDKDGVRVSDGIIRITLRDCDSSAHYFTGDFDFGSDLSSNLSSDGPIAIYGGSMDWSSEIQPYFGSPAVLDNGQTYSFDKLAWAKATGLYKQAVLSPNGKPVNLCTDYRINAGEGFSDPTTVKFLKAYNYSADNDALDAIPNDGMDITGVRTYGGPVFIDSAFSTDPSPGSSSCNYERINHIVRPTLKHAIGVYSSGSWQASSVTSTRYWETIQRAIGASSHKDIDLTTSGVVPAEYGVHCVDAIDTYYVYSALLDGSIKRVRLSDIAGSSEYIEVQLGIYQVY